MKIALTGASGFLGRALCASLRAQGHELTVLGRDEKRLAALLPEARALRWDAAHAQGPWVDAVRACDAVVHLAGEPVMARRWSPAVKDEILQSRVRGTRALVEAIRGEGSRVRTLVSASGIDYYGDTGERACGEDAPRGSTFLSEVCRQWEGAAQEAEGAGVRVLCLRIGVVLGEAGGAVEQMALPFRFFVGGPVGSGRQWFSWVHREDLLGLVRLGLEREELRGALNAVAPEPVRQGDFARALGRAMKRPSWAPVPGFALRVAVGEAAGLLLESKRVVPDAARAAGFAWRHADPEEALRASVGR